MTDTFDIIELDRVDSTNTYLLHHQELWERNFLTVMAREQTSGRGRYGRSWHSEKEIDLTFSMLFIPPALPGRISCVTILAGLALHRALKSFVNAPLSIKWPNDILSEGRKLAGILCETAYRRDGYIVIIGIGVNVNGTVFPGELYHTATSLKNLSGTDHDTQIVLHRILAELNERLRMFYGCLGQDTVQEWNRTSDSIGRAVRYFPDGIACRGVVCGIDTDGALLIQDSSKERVTPWYGEIEYA